MEIEICQEECCFKDYSSDEDVFHLCMEFMAKHNLAMSDEHLITNLYLKLGEMNTNPNH